ncbi:hypothetical protein N7522_001494 [Penicillium canescens]|nr:hypothetical protein N7522_001494 [Penicillium canescens]
MTLDMLKLLASKGTEIMKDAWHLDSADLDFPNLLVSVTQFQIQLEVQNVLLSCEKQLRRCPTEKPLPNQLANRVKRFVKFVFEESPRDPTRQAQLRKLDCSSMKFCGLSYTVREIVELAAPQFDFLMERVSNFVEQRALHSHLCRDDIHKAVLNDFDPEDDEAFMKFLNAHIEMRIKIRRDNRSRTSDGQAVDALSTGDDLQDVTELTTRKRIRLDHTEQDDEKTNEGRQIQYMHTNAPISHMQKLGDLLANAVRTSSQWKIERSLEEATTSCLTIMVPENPAQDISLTLWVGPEAGHHLTRVFNLAPKWSSSPNHAEP